jgi:hypothetical protein
MVLHRRNLACIGCGCPRTGNGISAAQYQPASPPTRVLSSPRFVSSSGYSTSFPHAPISPTQPSPMFASPPQQIQGPPISQPSQAPPPSHPLLTPSGRAFAVGGKVQNVSSDPLSPCVMYWPDNEPVPEQGQIRPSGVTGVPVNRIFGLTRLIRSDTFLIPAAAHIKHWKSRSHRTPTW